MTNTRDAEVLIMTKHSSKIAFSNGVLQYVCNIYWSRGLGPGLNRKFSSCFWPKIGPGARAPAKIASFLPVFGQKLCEEEDKLA